MKGTPHRTGERGRPPGQQGERSSRSTVRRTGARMSLSSIATLVTVVGALLATTVAPAEGLQPRRRGSDGKDHQRTASRTYDFAALKSLGVTINDGSFPHAYGAMVAYMNTPTAGSMGASSSPS